MPSRLIADIELHHSHAELIVLPPPCLHSIAPLDFGRAAELIERSAQDARAFRDKRRRQSPPIRMRLPDTFRQEVRNGAVASRRDHATGGSTQ
jgi:hypothetical protein